MTTSWKQLLTEAESLTKSNGKEAWRVAQIVRDLFKSETFLLEACNRKPDDRDSKLAKFSGRFALGLNDMIQMIEHFPDVKNWESGRLDILRDETCKLLNQRRMTTADVAPKERKTVTLAQYDELKRRYRALQERTRKLEKENAEMRKQLEGKPTNRKRRRLAAA